MAIVYKADLLDMEFSSYFSKLENSNNNIANKIESFCASSESVLTGNGYDAIRISLRFYADALRKSATLCGLFANNVIAAQHQLANYMEDLDVIDDALIPETRGKLNAAKADLARLESYYRTTWTDEKGNSHESWERVGTDEEIEACKEVIAYLEHILKKMEGLNAADVSAFSLLDAITNDINSLDRAINGIEVLNFAPNFLDSLDMEKLTDEEREMIEELMANWPEDLSADRKEIISIALSYLHGGHEYHMDNTKGNPTEAGGIKMDCAYFVGLVMKTYQQNTGKEVTFDETDYTGYYAWGKDDKNFIEINRDDLKPGDIVLHNRSTGGLGSNHIAIYLGNDNKGNPVFIECSSNKGTPCVSPKDEAVRITYEDSNPDHTANYSQFRRPRDLE